MCQKSSNLVQIWRSSDKNKLGRFLAHPVCDDDDDYVDNDDNICLYYVCLCLSLYLYYIAGSKDRNHFALSPGILVSFQFYLLLPIRCWFLYLCCKCLCFSIVRVVFHILLGESASFIISAVAECHWIPQPCVYTNIYTTQYKIDRYTLIKITMVLMQNRQCSDKMNVRIRLVFNIRALEWLWCYIWLSRYTNVLICYASLTLCTFDLTVSSLYII